MKVQRPLAQVQAFFDLAGVQSVLHPSSSPDVPTTLDGYFSCSNPPTFGFGIPSASNASEASQDAQSPVSHTSKIFNVLPSQLVQISTGDNCTASIHGTDEWDFWLIGQGVWNLASLASWAQSEIANADNFLVFFQGKYVDHNHDDETMGFAVLSDL